MDADAPKSKASPYRFVRSVTLEHEVEAVGATSRGAIDDTSRAVVTLKVDGLDAAEAAALREKVKAVAVDAVHGRSHS
jgi:hypothetical protein